MNEAYFNRTQLQTKAVSRGVVRVMARLLILSLLTLNAAWATDTCTLTGCTNDGTYSSVAADEPSPVHPAVPGLDCDDWCNACVSHIAFPNTPSLAKQTPAGFIGKSIGESYSSRIATPPTHPPIV